MEIEKQLDRASEKKLDTMTVFIRKDGCKVNIKTANGGWECNAGQVLSETVSRALSRFLGKPAEDDFMDLLQ